MVVGDVLDVRAAISAIQARSGGATTVSLVLRMSRAFAGDISNSGTITAQTGIAIDAGVTFAAGSAIVNSGTITGTGGTAINLLGDQPGDLDITGGTIVGNIVGPAPTAATRSTSRSAPARLHLQQHLHQFRDRQHQFRHGAAQRREQQRHDGQRQSGGTLAGTGTIDPPVTASSHAGGTLAPGMPGTAAARSPSPAA